MRRLHALVKRHQIVSFFALTFAITWGLGFSLVAVMKHQQYLLLPVASAAICGPGLAGIILSIFLSGTDLRFARFKVPLTSFLLAWGTATIVFVAHQKYINHGPVSAAFFVVAASMALPVSYIIASAFSRTSAVRRYLASLVDFKSNTGWILTALLVVPALVLLSAFISSFLGRQPLADHTFPAAGWSLAALVAVKFVYQLFFYNATGEEAGWRGFALPRLQGWTTPLIASLVLALFWELWHLPLWFAEGKAVFTLSFWTDMYVSLIPATITIVWIYNRSKGSILAAGIVHAAANTIFAFLPDLDWRTYDITCYAFAAAIVLIERWWKRLPRDHPATKRK